VTESIERITVRNKRRAALMSGYGMIKRTEIICALPPDEREELRRMDDRQFDGEKLSATQEARMGELWDRAHELHAEKTAIPRTPDNDLFLYAEEIGEQMRRC
jgi:hypothetical protein